jgi:hypothetical protein
VNTSVCQILEEKYAIHAKPKARIDCPFCKHNSMSIKSDDTLAKCFHPTCERFVTLHQSSPTYRRSLHRALEAIFQDFHQHFLSLADSVGNNVYKYCLNEREIHPQVLQDASLGAVPAGYDVGPAFEPVIKEVTDALNKAVAALQGKKGRPTKMEQGRIDGLKGNLEFVKAKRQDLADKIEKRSSWLTFHYTDSSHRYTAIRLRNPFEAAKAFAFVSYNPYKSFGLFGLQMFPRGTKKIPIEKLIITEGEFNTLQLQSLLVRYGTSQDTEYTYLYAASVGGVNNADYPTIQKVSSDPILLYDNDKDNAGFTLVNRALDFMSIEAATTPDGHSDIDELITSFNGNIPGAWKVVQDLLEDRKWFFRHFAGLADEILEARDSKLKEHRINHRVKHIVKEDLIVRGNLYHDDLTAYFFLKQERKLLEISHRDHEFTLLMARYGINPAESISRYVVEGLHTDAFLEGPRIDMHRFSYYDAENFTLYIHNYANRMYRVEADRIELVNNGTDGVLFLSDSRAEPFLTDLKWFREEYRKVEDDPPDFSFHKVIIEMINFAEDILTPKERCILFMLWVFANFFREINKTRPLLAWIGEKGSGKSITNKKLGTLFFGSKFELSPLPEKCEDFDAIITNRPFVCVDNADTRKRWFEDRLATLGTSGAIPRRKLYTTMELIDYSLDCFVSITSRTPKFRRDDVADRLLFMKSQRFKHFLPENQLVADVLRIRDRLWVEIIFHLQNVVQALYDYRDEDFSTAFRMADFADFGLKIAKYAQFQPHLESIFQKLAREQSEYTLHNQPILDLLQIWVPGNEGKIVTCAQLLPELREIAAKEEGIEFNCNNARSFSQQLTNLLSNLEEFFDIKRGKDSSKTNTYIFREKQK